MTFSDDSLVFISLSLSPPSTYSAIRVEFFIFGRRPSQIKSFCKLFNRSVNCLDTSIIVPIYTILKSASDLRIWILPPRVSPLEILPCFQTVLYRTNKIEKIMFFSKQYIVTIINFQG